MAFTAKILSWRFRHLNIVGCLLKRRPTKGGGGSHGHPRTPLATPLLFVVNCLNVTFTALSKSIIGGNMTVGVRRTHVF